MTIGVLALQGAFAEHEAVLEKLNVDYRELRQKEDLDTIYDGFILPGGESTVQGKLLKDLGMFEPLKKQLEAGAAVLATCAGLILLANKIEDQSETYFKTIPMTVKRNAYGRQLGSFFTNGCVNGLGEIPMTFIRAPYVSAVSDEVEILSEIEGRIVGVRYKNELAVSFHPELDSSLKIHHEFLNMAARQIPLKEAILI